jgi:hypothetical protein
MRLALQQRKEGASFSDEKRGLINSRLVYVTAASTLLFSFYFHVSAPCLKCQFAGILL